ncbi:Poly(glycerol-phosphate) alpha-glucosyltransferase [Pseudonocardia sp. Ae168_Ps1]|uniref:glycosyltransferase family 4 protein n=1 Tax=unclassified Pseudonocardia TaxID=2619320 RepID=UPI00094B77D6|nr:MULTISPECIES: glycosyltransferase family 4 protein [unclassified Pseudonocardia]OLL72952.1 Poly(glycerol-phosphate) alpha-glucosyltransferase [Pseudonocardia sp. Ae150A_Ps1]OLL78928.1 Poly(glycerol-phosphate) alpha-glucosyltransferase [Pseudonocardia sp. Ae168_Ps1]OLL86934.1 Poly(glycerol-phosphate) alpha-glucosyltransferase [Pseudonocardia sp. Ae263_Ps1]OLL93021.1 Poly(glycerol-phosphate) alpha-glucosyltransferase [Pseudonocardia sp. Ae356_Ps1]
MARTLLVTNDFPPRPGGIQSYLHDLACALPVGELAVYAPAWRGDHEFDVTLPFPVHRHRSSLMLPVPEVARRAAGIAREHGAGAVWFGAAAPLGLLGPSLRRRAGIGRVVATTHGHEVGWSMLPGARAALRRIGADADVVTTVSRWTRDRFAAAFGPDAALEPLPPPVDTTRFAPDPAARAAVRARYGLGGAPVVACVSRLVPRKGQDVLVAALPAIRERVPGARLLLVGGGPYRDRLRRLAVSHGVADAVVLTGGVPAAELAAHHAAGDVFALPCRTHLGGLDVEGLGIALLEAAASGLPVVAGDSGGAPETVEEGVTGHVVGGRDVSAVADRVAGLLADPARASAMGRAGRDRVRRIWGGTASADRLRTFLHPHA